MKIAGIETFVVGNPPPHYGGRYFLFVKLTSNDGITGWGECYSAAFNPHLTAKLIEDLGARYLDGHDPHDVETLFRRCHGSGFSQRPDPTVMGAFSATVIDPPVVDISRDWFHAYTPNQQVLEWSVNGKGSVMSAWWRSGCRARCRRTTCARWWGISRASSAPNPVWSR